MESERPVGELFKQDERCPICEGGGYVAIPQARA